MFETLPALGRFASGQSLWRPPLEPAAPGLRHPRAAGPCAMPVDRLPAHRSVPIRAKPLGRRGRPAGRASLGGFPEMGSCDGAVLRDAAFPIRYTPPTRKSDTFFGGIIMLVTTGNEIVGQAITSYLGLVRGIVVRS